MQMHSSAPQVRRTATSVAVFAAAAAVFASALFASVEATGRLIAARSQQTHVVPGSFMPDTDAGSVYRRDMGAPSVVITSSR